MFGKNKYPTVREIKEARRSAGLTQREAAALIHCSVRSWEHWESEASSRKMHPAFLELFTIKAIDGFITKKCDSKG